MTKSRIFCLLNVLDNFKSLILPFIELELISNYFPMTSFKRSDSNKTSLFS